MAAEQVRHGSWLCAITSCTRGAAAAVVFVKPGFYNLHMLCQAHFRKSEADCKRKGYRTIPRPRDCGEPRPDFSGRVSYWVMV